MKFQFSDCNSATSLLTTNPRTWQLSLLVRGVCVRFIDCLLLTETGLRGYHVQQLTMHFKTFFANVCLRWCQGSTLMKVQSVIKQIHRFDKYLHQAMDLMFQTRLNKVNSQNPFWPYDCSNSEHSQGLSSKRDKNQ